MPVAAVQHVRKMRGGAQAQLLRGADGYFYVVKFQNNPQHLRVLANELLATRLAERVGLPVPVTEIVEVTEWLVQNTPDLRMELSGTTTPCAPGLQLGVRYVCDPTEAQVFDYLPESMLAMVKERESFAGMLVLDKWLGNANGRQAVFWKKPRERKYRVSFIDQGYCFNAGIFPIPPCAAFTRAIAYTISSAAGSHSNPGSHGSRISIRRRFARSRERFHPSGSKATGPLWKN